MVAYWRSFIVSCLVHVLLTCLLFLTIHNAQTGNNAQRVIQAFLYAPTVGAERQPQQRWITRPLARPLHPLKKSPLGLQKSVTQQHLIRHNTETRASHQLDPGSYSLLLAKLHDAIAEHLIYPHQALFLNEVGTTRLSFMLQPTGEIKHIAIIKSSHSPILDRAAVATVKKISPFLLAKKMLQVSQYIEVPIQFSD